MVSLRSTPCLRPRGAPRRGSVRISSLAEPLGTAIEGSPEYIACNYLIFWGTDFDVDAWDTCPGGEKAKVAITLDASQAALMDIFGFFDGKELKAEVSMRKEDAC